MNFFEAQDRARRSTRWLVFTYFAATALIVAGVTMAVNLGFFVVGQPGGDPAVLVAAALLTLLLILGATLYKTASLSAGGGKVALDMGGTPVEPDVQDPLKRRLRNVVEEMSIASGISVPDIYVLEAEEGINAFAAGYSPDDAAIAVTRGALEKLNRDELQGVIAHEFSHILNGDMRINIRMMGVLFGIMVLSLVGRMVLRSSFYGRGWSSRRSRGLPPVLIVGATLAILGWIGVLLARLIKAAVSRQREMLADASAVQFTRQTEGLANALKKIGGFPTRSYITAVDPEEVSHMLFARGLRRSSLFATHPPLVERIRALEPGFDGEFRLPAAAGTAPAAMGFAPGAPRGAAPKAAEAVGNPAVEQIAYARRLRESIPADLYDAAHSHELAYLLALALILPEDGGARPFELIGEQMGAERTGLVRRFHRGLVELGPQYRLPLLEIALPALKRRPAPQLEYLLALVRRLIEADSEIHLHEYCYYRVLEKGLAQGERTPRRVPGGSRRALRTAAIELVRGVAAAGHEDAGARRGAYMAATAHFGAWAAQTDSASFPETALNLARLDRALDLLERADPATRRTLVEALESAILHDEQATVAETELLRAICATLDCPLPPFVAELPLMQGNRRPAQA